MTEDSVAYLRYIPALPVEQQVVLKIIPQDNETNPYNFTIFASSSSCPLSNTTSWSVSFHSKYKLLNMI
jgi:hypothetical protein